MRPFALALPLIVALGCSQPPPPPPPAPPPGPAVDEITTASLVSHIQRLSSDEFQGRAPATPGG